MKKSFVKMLSLVTAITLTVGMFAGCGNKSASSENGFEYVKDELKDIFAMADVVISRAGANTICELLALRKPNILIPLPASQSRGDQLLNAASFERQGFSKVLEEESLTNELLLNAVNEVFDKKEEYRKTMSSSTQTNAVASIVSLIEELI